jgi:hypothetical protein
MSPPYILHQVVQEVWEMTESKGGQSLKSVTALCCHKLSQMEELAWTDHPQLQGDFCCSCPDIHDTPL